jgi:hypothetical protein
MQLNEFDMYKSIKSLMNYLKTEVNVSPGEVEKKGMGKVYRMTPGHLIKITVSNTAPVEKTWPMIVFTGVCLVTKGSPESRTNIGDWENSRHYKVDISGAQEKDIISSIPESSNEMEPLYKGFKYFPILTGDESQHGYSLFPGQSIDFEIGVIGEDKPIVKDLNLWVQGNLSRRHLFHSIRPIV